MTTGVEDGIVFFVLDAIEANRRGKLCIRGCIGSRTGGKSVWKLGSLLFGSSGGWPPFGEASTISAPASLNMKYGAASSSSQKPVFRPVLPSLSCEVRTIRISS